MTQCTKTFVSALGALPDSPGTGINTYLGSCQGQNLAAQLALECSMRKILALTSCKRNLEKRAAGCPPGQLVLAAGLVIVHYIHVKVLAARLLLTPRRLGCDGGRGRITTLQAQLALQAALERLQAFAAPQRSQLRCAL